MYAIMHTHIYPFLTQSYPKTSYITDLTLN